MRRIIVLNQKGGVGKTTTVANLGACLADVGKSVLVVDVDPQANLSLHCGAEVPRGAPSLYTFIRGDHGPGEVVRSTSVQRLSIIPSNIDLAGMSVEFSARPGRFFALRTALDKLAGRFDYVILDSPPSLGLLTVNAMCAAREVFIPLQTHFFALQGVGKLVRTVRRVRDSLNTSLRVTGVLACMYDSRTCLAREILDEITKCFGPRLFKTVIRTNIRLAEAPGFGLPITHYDQECHGAADYRSLALEVVAMEAAAAGPGAIAGQSPPASFSRAG